MSKARDVEVKMPGIVAREHPIRRFGFQGKVQYPFAAMLIGDYFILETAQDAAKARSAASMQSKRNPLYRFTVRLDKTGSHWVCRRIKQGRLEEDASAV